MDELALLTDADFRARAYLTLVGKRRVFPDAGALVLRMI